MSRIPLRELRRMGVSQEDIDLALATQAAQRRNGSPVQSVAVLVGAVPPRHHRPDRPANARSGAPASPPTDLTERALRRRGTYDQAALLLDQQALQESSPERAERARTAAQTAKELGAAQQIEFDFFGGGNVSIAFQYQHAITARLNQIASTPAKRNEALAVLWQIVGNLGWQTYECTKTAADLCDMLSMKASDMSNTLKLLEQVGAICRVKRGRTKVITVTPEGAFRGNVNVHGQVVERYKLDVIEGGKSGAPDQ